MILYRTRKNVVDHDRFTNFCTIILVEGIMKRKNLNQKEYGYTHTKQRLKERYGLEITRSEYDTLCEKVRKKEYILSNSINKQKKGLQFVFDTMFKGQIIKIVWENHRDCITTILPEEN